MRAAGDGVAHEYELSPRASLFMLVWSGLWLLAVLVSPVVDLAGRHPARSRLVLATVATIAFAVVYEVAVWSVMSEREDWAGRRWVWTAILGAFAVGLALAFGGDFVVAFLFVAVSAAMTLPERQGRIAVAAVSGATLAFGLALGVDSSRTWAFAITVLMIGIALTWVRRMVDLIHQLRQAREQVARLAVNEERLRFARDLHDLLGHSLSTIALKTQVARRLVTRDPQAAERELEEVEALTQRSLGEVRDAVGGYRRITLAGEIEGARSALAAAGIAATITTDDRALDDSSSVLAWTIREGVTNVIRHSGARRCDIVVHGDDGAATVEVVDDGKGTPSLPMFRRDTEPGSGLTGLAERVRSVGGHLEAGRLAGGGFRLVASVPLKANARGRA